LLIIVDKLFPFLSILGSIDNSESGVS